MEKKLDLKRTKLFPVMLIIMFGIVVIRLLQYSTIGMPSFDGGMNLQVPIRFMREGVWGTIYDGGIRFDNVIQTGFPVLFPIFILFSIFGVGATQALITNSIYFILLIYIVYKISVLLNVNKWVSLALAFSLLFFPFIFEFGFGVYGEIPTLFWLLLSVYYLIKFNESSLSLDIIISGLGFSMAFMTKTVILIALPSLIIVFASKILIEKKMRIYAFFQWITACAIPLMIFELFKLSQLGYTEYRKRFSDLFVGITDQAGITSGFQDTPNIIEKFISHMNIFSENFGINVFLLFFLLAVNLIILFAMIGKRKKLEYRDIIPLVAFSYFGWWLLITPTEKAWSRRILIGAILMYIVTIYIVDYLLRKYSDLKIVRIILAPLCLILALVQVNYIVHPSRIRRNNLLSAVDYIHDLKIQDPDSLFCGIHWWQAPVMSVLSGVEFCDLNNLQQDQSDFYFVEDYYLKAFLGDASLLDIYESTIVYAEADPYLVIYKITDRYPYLPFKDADYRTVSQSSFDSSDNDDYTSGIYGYEDSIDIRWSTMNSAFLFKVSEDNTDFKFSFTVEGYDIPSDEFEMNMTIFINSEKFNQLTINRQGEYLLEYPAADFVYSDTVLEVWINTDLSIDTHGKDSRELSYKIHSIGFYPAGYAIEN